MGGYGQNLACVWGDEGSLKDQATAAASGVSDGWYNGEFDYYVNYFGKEPPAASPVSGSGPAWGHLTQVVWKSTEKVGCHTAKCGPGTTSATYQMPSWYTVCNYDPPGKL